MLLYFFLSVSIRKKILYMKITNVNFGFADQFYRLTRFDRSLLPMGTCIYKYDPNVIVNRDEAE